MKNLINIIKESEVCNYHSYKDERVLTDEQREFFDKIKSEKYDGVLFHFLKDCQNYDILAKLRTN